MNKSILKNNKLEKISGGDWKNINKRIELTTSGIECVVGLATLGLITYGSIKKKNKPKNHSAFINFDHLANLFNKILIFSSTFFIFDGTRRFISQTENLY